MTWDLPFQLEKAPENGANNIVFDFLGGYHTLLEQESHYLTANHQETQYLI